VPVAVDEASVEAEPPVAEADPTPPEVPGAREDDQRAFTPPPVSVEDLATVSSLPRLGILNRLRDR
jgi:hypothetical protein